MPDAFASVSGKPIVRLGTRLAPPLARDHPERREDGSGIRRKVESQRHAECKIKRDAGCDCNSGRIHFPTPYALCTDVRLPDHENLGRENGSLKP
jgi:hypothetical protein